MKHSSQLLIFIFVILFAGCVNETPKVPDYTKMSVDEIIERHYGKPVKIEISNISQKQKLELKRISNYINMSIREIGYVKSIRIVNFKGKRYISFWIGNNDMVSFNSIKFNKISLGRYIFEKYILPAIQHIEKLDKDFENIYGYHFDTGFILLKNFVSNGDLSILSYDFYIPSDVLKEYINYKITNKQLAKKSIILVKNNRIEIY